MGGFFNFLTTIATNGRGRPFETFLAVTSRYRRKSMKTLEELTPGGCRWPVADLCTAGDRPGSKTRFCGEPVEERSVGTQLCPYCATHAAMAYTRVGHQSINDRAKAHRKIVSRLIAAADETIGRAITSLWFRFPLSWASLIDLSQCCLRSRSIPPLWKGVGVRPK